VAPRDTEQLAERLSRLKALAKSLEDECAESAEAQAKFDALKREIDALSVRLAFIRRL
jgi:hypothetical protein